MGNKKAQKTKKAIGIKFVEASSNTKLAGKDTEKLGVSATYAPINNTCPSTCELKKEGCYAKISFVGIINANLQKQSKSRSALDMAKEEVKAIDQSFNGGTVTTPYLRLHVSGDSRTIRGSKAINSSIKRWKERGGKIAWSYTHAWKKVPRSAWSNVSMLASVKNISEAKEAIKAGYAPAMVVASHPENERAFRLDGCDIDFIPCPAQSKKPNMHDISCARCRLCLNADRLHKENKGIAFAAHGAQKNNIKRKLKVLQ